MSQTQRTQRPITLITGGSRGLGRNAALHLAEAGHDLIVTYRNHREEAEAVVTEAQARGVRALALPLDVGQSASFPAFAEAVRRWPTRHHYFGGVSLVSRSGAAGDPRRNGAAATLR